MEIKRYPYNYAQDIVDLQTKYALFKRVLNILFSVQLEGGFDPATMTRALEKLYERNDCLRLTFVKEGKRVLQYVAPERKPGNIPTRRFSTTKEQDAFLKRWRRSATNVFKGNTLETVFVTDSSGRQHLFCKISHMVADSYGVGVLVNDLVAVYRALAEGRELPPAPGSFETVLAKDAEYKANPDLVEKDKAFFEEYYFKRHTERPLYCGIHGDENDRWLRQKRKGNASLPFLLVRCDTEGYQFIIPAAVTRACMAWCEGKHISLNTFFFYTYALAASLKNDKAPNQLPLCLLNCRGTLAERKAAGNKVQSMSVYTSFDYAKSFEENMALFYDEQNELFRHTHLSYLEVEAMQHREWKHSLLSQFVNFAFSYIPVSMAKGVSMRVYSNGKGALPVYVALMHNVDSDEISVIYDIQVLTVTPRQLVDFQCLFVSVIEKVLSAPDAPLNELF